MRALIIEDDLDTLEFIQKRLVDKCFAVDTATTGHQGMSCLIANDYDIVLIDYGLPDKDGLTIIQELRNITDNTKKNTPVIMISITHELATKIDALDYGADDYIAKPFFFGELFARIQAILRRPNLTNLPHIATGNLVLDSSRQQVTLGGSVLHLTRKEFSLLEYLMRNKGVVVSRSDITEHVWDRNVSPFSNTIDTHIANLRKKIEIGTPYRFIHSIPGRGYILEGFTSSEHS